MEQTIQNTNMQQINPLLDRIRMPGETFTLPSGGIFYTNGELRDDVKNGEVHIFPMTALDEIIIKSPDMLYSGKAIEEVFTHCIPQVLKPSELLARDVDFLLICLRKVSFGPEMSITHTHTCENAKENSYLVSMDQFIKSSKRIDPTTVAALYTAELPNSQRVKLQPVRYKDFVALLQTTEMTTPEQVKAIMIQTLLNVIVDVDGISDRQLIAEWLEQMPAGWLHIINEKIDETVEWGPTFTTKIKCRDCGKDIQLTAPLNPVAFFTLR